MWIWKQKQNNTVILTIWKDGLKNRGTGFLRQEKVIVEVKGLVMKSGFARQKNGRCKCKTCREVRVKVERKAERMMELLVRKQEEKERYDVL